jgi:hypothetical protein
VPENWATEEWLSKASRRFLVSEIAKAVGISPWTIRFYYRKFKIKSPGVRVRQLRNPYFSHAWCYEHYVVKGWSHAQCAKVAGICKQTFSNWLVALGIPVRTWDMTCKKYDIMEMWVTETVEKLKRLECVRTVHLRNDHIHVRYKNFFWESYFFRGRTLLDSKVPYSYSLDSKEARLESVPEVKFQYDFDLMSCEYPGHLIINAKQFKSASFLEQRVAIHDFAWQICRRGFVWPKHPINVLENDLEEISKRNKYLYKGSLLKVPRTYKRLGSPGFKVIEHFFGFREMWDGFVSSPKKCVGTINELVKSKVDINTHNLLRFMMRRYRTPIFELGVGMYVELFKKANLKGTVLDIRPGFGFRALACACLGLKYRVLKTEHSLAFEKAINEGFADFIGLDFEWYKGQQANILMCDDDLKGCDFDIVRPHIEPGRTVVYYAKDRFEFEKAGAQPLSAIPVAHSEVATDAGYFFVL